MRQKLGGAAAVAGEVVRDDPQRLVGELGEARGEAAKRSSIGRPWIAAPRARAWSSTASTPSASVASGSSLQGGVWLGWARAQLAATTAAAAGLGDPALVATAAAGPGHATRSAAHAPVELERGTFVSRRLMAGQYRPRPALDTRDRMVRYHRDELVNNSSPSQPMVNAAWPDTRLGLGLVLLGPVVPRLTAPSFPRSVILL